MVTNKNIAENINIKDIHLIHVNSRREPVPPAENAKVDISCEPVIEHHRPEEKHFTIICKFNLDIHDEDKDVYLMKLAAEYCVVYEINDTIEQFSDNDGVALVSSAVFNCWPSFRELVHRLVIDAGLPAFILPTLTEKKLREFDIKHPTRHLD